MNRPNPVDKSFLPNFCSPSVLFVVIVAAELFVFMLFFARLEVVQDYLFTLAMQSLFIQWIALTSAGLLCLLRSMTVNISDAATAFFAYLLILLNTFLITELAWYFLYFFPRDVAYFAAPHGRLLLQSLGVAAIVAALVLYYLYIQHQRHCQSTLADQARFEALQSRIRPHFLFNCMNTIASLTRTDPLLAERTVEDLSDLFRASLTDPNTPSYLQDELDFCRRYLHIEQQRLGHRLTVLWDTDALPKDARLPLFTLQPLLENAVYHGIELMEHGGTIKISGVRRGRLLYIYILNPLPKDRDRSQIDQGYQLAQKNIRQRLRLFYGAVADIVVEQTACYYHVTFCIPYQVDADLNR